MKLKFEDRISSYLAGEMSVEEKLAFEKEVDKSSVLKRELESYQKIWLLTNQLDYSQDETDTSWEYFQRKIEAPFNLLGLDWLKIAASITLLAAVSFGMWFFGSTDINLTTEKIISTHQLVDKSEVILDHNSELAYNKDFGKVERYVSLKGQALFDVAHSEKRFIIDCALGDIVVHGTSFNLFSNDNLLVLELIDGSVSFSQGTNEMFVEPGERLVVSANTSRVEEYNSPTTWQEDINCTNAPLVYIMEQLTLVYNIQYDLPAAVLNEKYTVTLPKNSIRNCLNILNRISGQSFAFINDKIVLQ